MTSRLNSILPTFAIVLVAGIVVPREAAALAYIASPGTFNISLNARNNCYAAGYSTWFCNRVEDIVDPTGTDITGIQLSVQFDPSRYIFDPGNSGPLGAFSIGGDAPPTDPGVGTGPVETLPSTGYSPGSQLSGSTLTYTVTGNTVTLNYQFPGTPITVDSDVNAFILAFDYINQPLVDLTASTVTYSATGPGADFTFTPLACTTLDQGNHCGVDPSIESTGISFDLALVPEPNSLSVMLIAVGGLAALGTWHRRRTRTS